MIVHYISTECYPVAKVGGLGDVTGALPKYLDAEVAVVLPKYDMPWFSDKTYQTIYGGHISWPDREVAFEIQLVGDHQLGFPFYVISIPELFARDGVYSSSTGEFFEDEAERYCAFQRAYLEWVGSLEDLPAVIHCQDHHTGLIPFMMQHADRYQRLKDIATIFTIHNERYQGTFAWEKQYLLPAFDNWKSGLIDWDHRINPLAAGVKCADAVTTVSPSYMEELKHDGAGLEWLFNHETDKLQGILNGIDHTVWDPKTDHHLEVKLKRSVTKFKADSKAHLLKGLNLDKSKPLVAFIGRLAVEKGADLLPAICDLSISQGVDVNFLILGTGDKTIQAAIDKVAQLYPDRIEAIFAYDEQLAHQIYAGADFIIMPSRVEPCGLNQMYALRYGAVPIVHNIGGLKDSIIDTSSPLGYGIKHDHLFMSDLIDAIKRASQLFNNPDKHQQIVKRGMQCDFSWDNSAQKYKELYQSVINQKQQEQ